MSNICFRYFDSTAADICQVSFIRFYFLYPLRYKIFLLNDVYRIFDWWIYAFFLKISVLHTMVVLDWRKYSKSQSYMFPIPEQMVSYFSY